MDWLKFATESLTKDIPAWLQNQWAALSPHVMNTSSEVISQGTLWLKTNAKPIWDNLVAMGKDSLLKWGVDLNGRIPDSLLNLYNRIHLNVRGQLSNNGFVFLLLVGGLLLPLLSCFGAVQGILNIALLPIKLLSLIAQLAFQLIKAVFKMLALMLGLLEKSMEFLFKLLIFLVNIPVKLLETLNGLVERRGTQIDNRQEFIAPQRERPRGVSPGAWTYTPSFQASSSSSLGDKKDPSNPSKPRTTPPPKPRSF